MVNFVATTHLRVKRDAIEATVARYLLDRKEVLHIGVAPLLIDLGFSLLNAC